jgi:hypothetical protein
VTFHRLAVTGGSIVTCVNRVAALVVIGVACSSPSPLPLHHVSTGVAVRPDSAVPGCLADASLPAVHDCATGEFPLPHGPPSRPRPALPCTDCHWDSQRSQMDFTLTATCNAARMCHDGDHTPTLGATCTVCHEPGRWDATRFDHDKPFPPGGSAPVTGYPLRGKHASLRCEACHGEHRDFALAKTTCVECHASDDAHSGSKGSDCERCHGETTWSSTP